MQKILFILVQLCLMAGLWAGPRQAVAQARIVRGKVVEQGSKQPLPGVTIVEVNENNRQIGGTTTDAEGNYSLKITDAGNKLKFSFISYAAKTESIGSRTVINVTMAEDGKALDEVSITARKEEPVNMGFGTVAKRDVIGAITSVKAEVLQYQPSTSIDQMLQGRAAGVQITPASGDPGAGASIRIRGTGSLTAGNEPLYVIDGIPIISDPAENTREARTSARSNPIADINPADIASIDILKDANATAIYGARASNGVIMITTKRGKGGKTTININSQYTVQPRPRAIPMLDADSYRVLRLDMAQNQGLFNLTNGDVRPFIDDPTIPGYNYLYGFDTNWINLIQQTGQGHNHTVSFNGGGESTRYNFSVGYKDSKGVLVNTGHQRFSSRFNLDYRVSDNVRFGSNISFTRSKTYDHAAFDQEQRKPYHWAMVRSPQLPVYDVDAEGRQLSTYASLPLIHVFADNPLAAALLVTNDAYSNNLKPNIYGEVQIIKGLKFRSNASIDFVGETGLLFIPPDATGEVPTGTLSNGGNSMYNRMETRDYERLQLITDNLFTYNRLFNEKHNVTFLVGNTVNKLTSSSLRSYGYNGPDRMPSLNASAGYRELRSSRQVEGLLSLFVKADYIFNDRYGINATARRDGSSKFGGNNKYATFPSVGAYWRVSSEPFMEGLGAISNLKLRAAWGQNGNSGIGNYSFVSSFSGGTNYMGYNGVRPGNIELDNLRWETSESTNLGLDLELFNGRLSITNEWYIKNTRDLLVRQQVPTSSGADPDPTRTPTFLTNLGDIRNRGVELEVAYDVVQGDIEKGEFNWATSFNIGSNDNLITRLPTGPILRGNVNTDTRSWVYRIQEGDPLGTYHGLIFQGVYAYDADAVVRDRSGNTVYELDGVTPKIMRWQTETGAFMQGGDAIYKDINFDGIINDLDKVQIGSANPKFFGGFNNSVNYKNFGLNFFVQFQYGNDVVNGLKGELEGMQYTNNSAITVLGRWRKQGDVTNIPRASRGLPGGADRNWHASSRFVEDGSYARVKYATLSYYVPRELSAKMRLTQTEFFFTATNFITWTRYTGADPEITIDQDGIGFPGYDKAFTPQTRAFTLGVNLRL